MLFRNNSKINVDVDNESIDPNCLLIDAINKNDYSGVVSLIKKYNISIHHDNDHPLRHAVSLGHIDIVNFLLINGANIHVMEEHPLESAVENGYPDIVELLIRNGADIHSHEDYPLVYAIENNQFDMVKLLINYGADIHTRDDYVFKCAIDNGYYELVNFFIRENHFGIDELENYISKSRIYNGLLKIIKILKENNKSKFII